MPYGNEGRYYCDECGRYIPAGADIYSSNLTGGQANYGGDWGKAKGYCSQRCLDAAMRRIIERMDEEDSSSSYSSPSYSSYTPSHSSSYSSGTSYHRRSSSKNKWIALLLWLFLGPIGAHYFYVGRVGRGIAYMFTAGFFVLGWIVDFFKIISGNFEDQYGHPLR